MKKIHTILLEEPAKRGTPEDTLVVYVARHGSQAEALLRMKMQGILPKYQVVSHAASPFFRTLMNMLFPSLQVIRHNFGKVTLLTLGKYWITRPLKRLFKGSSRKEWSKLGEYDRNTFRVYPYPEGQNEEA